MHTGPWCEVEPGRNGRSASAQLDLLQEAGVAPSAWIWVHAQNEARREHHVQAARRGAWVSFDGYRPGAETDDVAMLAHMRDAGLRGQALVSQDAGWYNAGHADGGEFKPFDPIFTTLQPALRRGGFGEDELRMLFVDNPARALALRAG